MATTEVVTTEITFDSRHSESDQSDQGSNYSRQRSNSRSSSFDLERGSIPTINQPTTKLNKNYKKQFETLLVYGHILEAVAAFTCLLVLFNVIIITKNFPEPVLKGRNVRIIGAFSYGFTVYVGIVAQLLSLGCLLVMVRTRFRYNQPGIPTPESTYSNVLLLSHIIIGIHWGLVTLWLFNDAGYLNCFTTEGLPFTVGLYRICDLIWLVRFLAGFNLLVWTGMTFIIAVFINKYYINIIGKFFPNLINST